MSDFEMIRELWASVPEGWMLVLRVIGIICVTGIICFIVLMTAALHRDQFPRLFGWAVGEMQSEEGEQRRDQ